MKYLIYVVLLILLTGCYKEGNAQNQPFGIYLEPVSVSGLMGIQSFACGQYNGKWLIACGRIDGLHKAMGMGMMGTPFPSAGSNTHLIVVDPETKQVWSNSISSLPIDIQEQLGSTNPEFVQRGNYLYIMGGYGYKSSESKHVTFDRLLAINVPDAINAITSGASIVNCVRQITDTFFQVTGGEVGVIGDNYYLVGGQNFDGTYHHMSGMGMFTQTYHSQIKKFKILDNGVTLTIDSVNGISDNVNLHRRDYNLVQQIMPDGEEGLTAFSGVFQPTLDLPFLNCVDIGASGYTVNNAFSQYYNHYQCANIALYSNSANEMHSVFFGGIAQYYDSAGILIQDNQVPFVKTIARVTRDGSGNMSEFKMPVEMPQLLGAGSEFIINETVPHYNNEVIKLDSLLGDTVLAGYILGGIQSPAPNVFSSSMMSNNGTVAVANVFKVYLIKGAFVNGLDVLNPQSVNQLSYQLYPNPTTGRLFVVFPNGISDAFEIEVTNGLGQVVYSEDFFSSKSGDGVYSIEVPKVHSGLYNVTVKANNQRATQLLVVH